MFRVLVEEVLDALSSPFGEDVIDDVSRGTESLRGRLRRYKMWHTEHR